VAMPQNLNRKFCVPDLFHEKLVERHPWVSFPWISILLVRPISFYDVYLHLGMIINFLAYPSTRTSDLERIWVHHDPWTSALWKNAAIPLIRVRPYLS